VSDTPWDRPGWFGEASSWIDAQIGRLGYRPTAPIERFRRSSISCILRAHTDAGDLFLKQSLRLPVFSDEPSVIEGLAARFPEHVPRVVAVDQRQGWMLVEDFGHPIGGEASADVWDSVFATFGRIQVDATAHAAEFAARGCRVRPVNQLSDQIDCLVGEAAGASVLDTLELRQLHHLAPRLEAMSRELQDHKVPRSLVHGDLHLANVAWHRGKCLFFDWADACISHPFLDVAYILAENATHEAQCRDAYLAPWTEYEPRDRLLTMWESAAPLSALHQAITYQQTACYLPEPSRSQFMGGAGYFVRQLLKSTALQGAVRSS
jgi:hypothetical protein